MLKIHNCLILYVKQYSRTCIKTNLFRFHCPPNQFLQSRQSKGILPVRYANTIPPPPGMKPHQEPTPIPFARQPRNENRGHILIVVPLITFILGTWQVRRLKWKTDLMEKIQDRTTREPIPLPSTNPEDLKGLEFTKVVVTGTFDHDNEIYYGPKPCFVNGDPNPFVVDSSEREKYGYNLVTPFILSGTGERILVNRGWIRTKFIKPKDRPWSKTEGEQTIVGLLRESEKPWDIGPENNPKYKVWYYRLIDKMANEKKCLPIYIDATEEHSIPNLLYGGQTMTKLVNNHLQYVFTWYGLTIGTGIMYYTRYIKR